MCKPVFIIGFMGAGKTTIGMSLSTRLSWDFIDLDKRIEEESGMEIPLIFQTQGEKGFREIEKRAFFNCADKKRTVISCGGGVVLDEDILQFLKNSENVILLTADTDTISERLDGDLSRPLLDKREKRQKISEMLEIRDPIYRSATNMIIDTSGMTQEDIVEKILSIME